jgi:hypothetical protein
MPNNVRPNSNTRPSKGRKETPIEDNKIVDAGAPTSAPPPDKGSGAGSTDGPPVAAKITVSLVAKAAEDLERTKEQTKYSKTDLVNKAIILYAFINSELMNGGELILRRPNGESHLIPLL